MFSILEVGTRNLSALFKTNQTIVVFSNKYKTNILINCYFQNDLFKL